MPELNKHIYDKLKSISAPCIIVVRPGALGDTLLTLPTISILKKNHPDASVFFCGSHWAKKLQPLIGDLYRYVPFDSAEFAPLFADIPPEHAPVPFSRADLIVLFSHNIQSTYVKNLKSLTECPVIAWDIQPPYNSHIAAHMANSIAEKHFQSPEELPLPPFLSRQTPKKCFINSDNTKKKPVIALHPGSGSPHKIVDPEYFAHLVDISQQNNRRPVLIQGPADADVCREVMERTEPHSKPDIFRSGSLLQLAEFLRSAREFIGNDSGVAHLAGCLGVKSKVLFKTTDPQIWAPLGPDVESIEIEKDGGYESRPRHLWGSDGELMGAKP